MRSFSETSAFIFRNDCAHFSATQTPATKGRTRFPPPRRPLCRMTTPLTGEAQTRGTRKTMDGDFFRFAEADEADVEKKS
jgi:hypothetical protein